MEESLIRKAVNLANKRFQGRYQMYEILEIDHYTGLGLQSFTDKNGNKIYGLTGHRKAGGGEGIWYPMYVFSSEYNNGKPKAMGKPHPQAVRLGDKPKAIEIMKKILKELEGE